MNLSILQETLSAALIPFSKFSSNKAAFNPNLRLTAEPDRLIISASEGDLELHAVVTSLAVDNPGVTVVPGKALIALVRTLVNERVDLQADPRELRLIQHGKHVTLRTVACDTFAAFPALPETPLATVPSARQFRAALEHIFTTDAELVHLRFKNGKLTIQATDNLRLHRAELPADGGSALWAVSVSAFKHLFGALPKSDKADSALTVYQIGDRPVLVWGHYIAQFTPIAAAPRLPDFLYPVFHTTFDVQTLIIALKRAALFNDRSIQLRTSVDGAELEVYSAHPDTGNCTTPLISDSALLPTDWRLPLDPALLLDALTKFGADRVTLRFSFAHIGPLWIEPAAVAEVPCAALVMPQHEKEATAPRRVTDQDLDEFYKAARADLDAYVDKHTDLALRVAIRERERRHRILGLYGSWYSKSDASQNVYGL